jgi:hypothetical protein
MEPAAAAPSCPTCAAGSGGVSYASPTTGEYSGAGASSPAPATPQPQIPTPATSHFPPLDPGPEAAVTGNHGLAAPPLLTGPGDTTASRPTVDIHTAVYRGKAPTATPTAAHTAAKVAVDATSWETVPAAK